MYTTKTKLMRHHKTFTISFLIWMTHTCIDIEQMNYTLPTSTLEWKKKTFLCCFLLFISLFLVGKKIWTKLDYHSAYWRRTLKAKLNRLQMVWYYFFYHFYDQIRNQNVNHYFFKETKCNATKKCIPLYSVLINIEIHLTK